MANRCRKVRQEQSVLRARFEMASDVELMMYHLCIHYHFVTREGEKD
jgi:hypothetical protein